MGVVDPKGAHALANPKHHSVAQFSPQSLAVGIVEIDIDDVLVLLRWVFGVFDRTVGPESEPFGMPAHPGMVGGALDREVERHLNAERRGGADEPAKICERAELRIDCTVATFRRTDCVRAAWITGLGNAAVVLAFAIDAPYRMDGHEVDHVETKSRDLGKARDAIVKARTLAGDLSLAARKHLVPCSKACRSTVDHDFELAGVARQGAARLAPRHQIVKRRGEHQLGALASIAAIEIPQQCPELCRIIRPGLA